MNLSEFDAWSAGESYERYMGRWSRLLAARFVEWLAPPRDADWLEIGCGTGALTQAVLASCAPRSLLATDRSTDFVEGLAARVSDPSVRFETADAVALPAPDRSVDVVASALVLNFVPDRPAALAEMKRALRQGGLLCFYVWDYPGGGMGFIDAFWKTAAEVDAGAKALDEGARFPFCSREGLADGCRSAGLDPVIDAIEVETEFPDFEAFWRPFTLGAGPAPGYLASLEPDLRAALRTRLAERAGRATPIRLPARAWAVKARLEG